MPYNPKLAAVLAGLPKDSVIARTAGALHTDQRFPGYDEEKEGQLSPFRRTLSPAGRTDARASAIGRR